MTEVKPQLKGILKKPKSQQNSALSTAVSSAFAPQQGLSSFTPPPPKTDKIPAVLPAQYLRPEDFKEPIPLETFERLSQFPSIRKPGISAANPAPEDVREFVTAVAEFQPGEYSDLIEERNCLGNCGYTLCPRPKRNYHGEFKILSSGIAKVEDVNKWCSDECALRALYIKVQLDNPSYTTRVTDGKLVAKIELRGEEKAAGQSANKPKPNDKRKADETDQLPDAIDQPEIDNSQQTTQKAAALAAERGTMGKFTPTGGDSKVEVTIKEKETVAPAQPPDPQQQSGQEPDMHLMLEGHKITFAGIPIDDSDEEDNEDDEDGDLLGSLVGSKRSMASMM
ncbi:hypothetical protein QBC46DRAFT_314906 [Diplogelasinospora grovesii]|uniref:RNA polymerase II subunit B1 CTD phosphatase RPAP2 homolog n=1 Tax=Diplogelasinospora grovesii TaxID=303347 RepID=A0AAN6S4M7_9PEZI|nr:hypothetical protein QBC46DRAFT_314906 [Diplogelasinospora grovesii]